MVKVSTSQILLRSKLQYAHGIQLEYLPVVSGRVTDEQAIEFKSLYQKSQKPVLAFCRSGTRSITLWALSQVAELTIDQMLLQSKL